MGDTTSTEAKVMALEARVAELESRVKDGDGISVEQMFSFYNERAVGTKEFRNFLAKVDPTFASVRDTSVDDEIDRNVREMQEKLEQARESMTAMVARDGEIVDQ